MSQCAIETETNLYDAQQVQAAREAEERAEQIEAERPIALKDADALSEIVTEMGQNPQAIECIGRMIAEGKDGAAGASLVALFKHELDLYLERMVD